MDLRSGEPIWLIGDKKRDEYGKLMNDTFSDILIIGAGISGALMAHALIKNGRKVMMVDSRGVGEGSTFASTAILTYETDINFNELINKFGEENATRIFQLGLEAIAYIENIASELDEPCDFERKDSVYFASTIEDIKIIEDEYKLRKKHGFDVKFINEGLFSELFSFYSPCALITSGAAQFNPVKFTRLLISKLIRLGLKVFTDTRVKDYYPDETNPRVVTFDDYIITSNCVIFCTGYETQLFLKQKEVTLKSTYVIASEPVFSFSGWFKKMMLWETSRPYSYTRTTSDNRIIMGGEDVDFSDSERRDALMEGKASALEAKFKSRFPQIPFKRRTEWTGTFAESNDSLPFIGPHPKFPGAYFSLDYGGNGTTSAAIAAAIITDLVSGRYNPDAHLFSFSR